MKVGDLIDLLYTYDNNDEIEIEVYETSSGHYIDTTAAITISEDMTYVPTLRIDIEAEKFRKFIVKSQNE